MKLIKVNSDHYIVVEGDDFHNKNLSPNDFAYHWRSKQIVQVISKTYEICSWSCTDGSYRDGYKLLKITHSTEPLSSDCKRCNGFCKNCVDNVKPISMQNVNEIIGESELLIPFPDKTLKDGGQIRTWMEGWELGYYQCLKDHKELTQPQKWEIEIINNKLKLKI